MGPMALSRARFQTNSREVEADAEKSAPDPPDMFQTNSREVEA